MYAGFRFFLKVYNVGDGRIWEFEMQRSFIRKSEVKPNTDVRGVIGP